MAIEWTAEKKEQFKKLANDYGVSVESLIKNLCFNDTEYEATVKAYYEG